MNSGAVFPSLMTVSPVHESPMTHADQSGSDSPVAMLAESGGDAPASLSASSTSLMVKDCSTKQDSQ